MANTQTVTMTFNAPTPPTPPALPDDLVESNNVSERSKVKKFQRDGNFVIQRTPCPTWAYLGLGTRFPREEGFNLTITTENKKNTWYKYSCNLMKINHCCGVVEMALLHADYTNQEEIDNATIPLINKVLEYAKKWGKGIVQFNSVNEEQAKFLKKHFDFRETVRFKNPNSGILVIQLIHVIGNCEVKEKV